MYNKYQIKKNLKNAEGKSLLMKTKLEYSKEIIKYIEQNPEELPQIIEILEIPEDDFFKSLSGEKDNNITL